MDYMPFLQFIAHVVRVIVDSGFVPFLLIITLVAIIMWRAHVDSNARFNIYDLVSNNITQKASVESIGMLMAMLSVTLWFMDLAAQHKATWSDAVAYGGLMGLAKVANKVIDSKAVSDSSSDTKE
jgi:hypothetical protein